MTRSMCFEVCGTVIGSAKHLSMEEFELPQLFKHTLPLGTLVEVFDEVHECISYGHVQLVSRRFSYRFVCTGPELLAPTAETIRGIDWSPVDLDDIEF